MRTFVALNLPTAERERMHASLDALRSRDLPVRWVDAPALHVTVKFLGDTASDGIEAIAAVLRQAVRRRGPVTLAIGGLGGFPSLRRASVLWLGIAPDAELAALQREMEPALSRLGYPREQRPFRPHITIGRTRGDGRGIDIERLGALVDYESTITVETVDLMQSHTSPQGARYELVLSRALGPEEHT
jgi:2'-5' RNA ligase